jgi:uncharacterized damage-inducible protein DinB
MLREFLLDKFEFDYQVNRTWSAHLQLHEDQLNPFIIKQMSHVINMHHIWLSRLYSAQAESGEWDELPLMYWDRLLQENYLKTQEFMRHFDGTAKSNYHNSEGVPMEKSDVDILYHILHHSQYHRAQIARELRIIGLPVPSMHFIAYR